MPPWTTTSTHLTGRSTLGIHSRLWPRRFHLKSRKYCGLHTHLFFIVLHLTFLTTIMAKLPTSDTKRDPPKTRFQPGSMPPPVSGAKTVPTPDIQSSSSTTQLLRRQQPAQAAPRNPAANYKSTARKVTTLMVALPIVVITSWVLYDRRECIFWSVDAVRMLTEIYSGAGT